MAKDKDLQQRFNNGEIIAFDKPTVILASGSKARAKKFEEKGIAFIQIVSNFDDSDINFDFPHEGITKRQEKQYVKSMALAKLEPFIGKIKNGIIITADTTVLCGGRILEKPITPQKCREQHEWLRGKTALVYTGIAMHFNGKTICKTPKIKYKFKIIPDKIIEHISNNEPETLQRAGFCRSGAVGDYCEIKSKLKTGDDVLAYHVTKMLKKLP